MSATSRLPTANPPLWPRSSWRAAIAVIGLILALSVPGATSAASQTPPTRYLAIDIGTLGGPDSLPNTPGRLVTDSGIVIGSATTPGIDPLPNEPGCPPPCPVFHAFQWQNGVMTDLGTLGGYNGGLFEINGSGVGAGLAETGAIDPLTGSPVVHAVYSSSGKLFDLGTLGGYESWGSAINAGGEIAGYASNAVADPDGFMNNFVAYPSGTQWRAVVWIGGQPHDLGTLGGVDSIAGPINDRGQVAGMSFTGTTVNGSTGLPTLHPFIWQAGQMRDLGTLGGTLGTVAWMNERGEVVGDSSLAGDNVDHPFLWNGSRLLDLGTLGGPNGHAIWISEAGQVVGRADLPPVSGNRVHHGFVWQNSQMTDLPPVDGAPCSNASVVNSAGVVVGNATDCHGNDLAAVLWQNGAAYDLNTLIDNPGLDLVTAEYINDHGDILTIAVLPNGDNHLVLLVPTSGEGSRATSVAHLGRAPAGARARIDTADLLVDRVRRSG